MRGLDLEKYISITVTITSTVAIPATLAPALRGWAYLKSQICGVRPVPLRDALHFVLLLDSASRV